MLSRYKNINNSGLANPLWSLCPWQQPLCRCFWRDVLIFDSLRFAILSAKPFKLFDSAELCEGSRQNLRQTEGREFLWTKGRGETGDPHQDGRRRRRKGHRQGRQNCKPTEALWFGDSLTSLSNYALGCWGSPELTGLTSFRSTSCRTWRQPRLWSPGNRRPTKTTRSSLRSMDISMPARYSLRSPWCTRET